MENIDFYMHWLCDLKGIGRKKIDRLLEFFGSPQEVYDSDIRLFAEQLRGFGINDDNFLQLESRCIKDEKWDEFCEFEKNGIRVVTRESVDYPEALKNIYDSPHILYYKGNLPKPNLKTVSIVGARNCTEYGRQMAKRIAYGLSMNGIQIVSGFARGIDTAAHDGCLKGDTPTFAVFGCGVNNIYPSENTFMSEEVIAKGGGILSEFSPNTQVSAGLFPLRNRIISGLSDIVVVIEAGEKSGSLITVEHALEQNKCVMALPGRVTDRLSMGCNNLIRQGAGIITSMEDILFELGIESVQNQTNDTNCEIKLASTEKMLYSYLDFIGQNLENLVNLTGLDEQSLMKTLVSMELKGLVKEISPNIFIRSN